MPHFNVPQVRNQLLTYYKYTRAGSGNFMDRFKILNQFIQKLALRLKPVPKNLWVFLES